MLSANASSASETRPCCSASAVSSERRVEHRALGEQRAVRATRARRVDAHELPVRELVEERRSRRVDEAHAGPHELERPGVREPAGRRAARR